MGANLVRASFNKAFLTSYVCQGLTGGELACCSEPGQKAVLCGNLRTTNFIVNWQQDNEPVHSMLWYIFYLMLPFSAF